MINNGNHFVCLKKLGVYIHFACLFIVLFNKLRKNIQSNKY